jgi:outer membrane protein assembly factor BamB
MELLMRIKFLFFVMLLFLASCSGRIRLKDSGLLDSPDWSCFRGDSPNTAYRPSSVGIPDELLWKYDAKKPLKSTPIIIRNIVIIGSLDRRVHFLDASSGKELGTQKVTSSVSASTCGEEDRVYFGLETGKETFFALNFQTGEVLWKWRLGDLSSSPALCGDKILVGSSEGTLWALNKLSGEEVWTFKTAYGIYTPAWVVSSLTASEEGMLCFGSEDGYLYALDADSGKTKWRYKAGGGIYSAPAVTNKMVFFGSVDGNLYALNLEDGSLLWKFQTGADIFSSPAAAESLVYIGSNDYFVYAVNQRTGKFSWKFETGGLVRSSPIAVGDKLFFGSFDGYFYVLNRFTGKLLWRYQTRGMISGSPAYFDGKIYIGSEDGFLYCFGS